MKRRTRAQSGNGAPDFASLTAAPLAMLTAMTGRLSIMGPFAVGRTIRLIGWCAVLLSGAAVVALAVSCI